MSQGEVLVRRDLNRFTIAPMKTTREVNCPVCGAVVPWAPESQYRPFCSNRCRKIDLGAWANDEYKIPAAPGDPDEEAQPED